MARSEVFEWLCASLESVTDFDRLEARGTVRIALKEAGLEAPFLTAEQVRVVLEKLMPFELERRGVGDPEAVCSRLAARLNEIPEREDDGEDASPEDVFARLE